MEENETFFGVLLEKVENYAKTTIDLVKLKAIDKLAVAVSNVVFGVLMALLVFFFLLILNLALAFWVGSLLGETYLGFFVMAGFYVLLIIILMVFKKQLIKAPYRMSSSLNS
jgi:apolipoprotein N-acyltransferase